MLNDPAQIEIVKKLGIHPSQCSCDGPYFSGWHPVSIGGIFDVTGGCIGMVIKWLPLSVHPASRQGVYVILPEMKAGRFTEGEALPVSERVNNGTRVYDDLDPSAMEEMLKKAINCIEEICI